MFVQMFEKGYPLHEKKKPFGYHFFQARSVIFKHRLSKAMNQIISSKKRVFISLVGPSGSRKLHPTFDRL